MANKKIKLPVELVPSTTFYSNLRSILNKSVWDLLRKHVYRQAMYVCEVCGGKGPKHPVEAHEEWSYDDKKKIQRLEKIVALCPDCHACKHLGRAEFQGKLAKTLKHLAKVNGWSMSDVKVYAEVQFEIFHERSRHQWHLDLSVLGEYLSVVLRGKEGKVQDEE